MRVKLKTSGVNPSDVKTRAGTARKIAFPRVIPHSDGAGVIDAVGEGVATSRIGERVWTWNGQWKRPFGTAAEYIVLPEIQAVKLPDAISFEAGACLGIPALTAWHAIDIAGAKSGMTLLIAGGAGAVAHYAIQFAKARGATVITTVSSPEKAKLATRRGRGRGDRPQDRGRRRARDGADQDRRRRRDRARPHGERGAAAATLRPRGTLVVYGTGPQVQFPGSFCLVNNVTVKFLLVYELTADERARAVAGITRMLEANRLKHNVAQTFPLAEIVAAHQAVESGKVAGNVVMTM